MEWTAEADAYLRRWYDAGKTAKQIGKDLVCTKNAVIGRACRLRLGASHKQPLTLTMPDAPPRYRKCQWINGEPSADAAKCGARVADGSRFSFCPDHLKRATVRPDPKHERSMMRFGKYVERRGI